MAQKQIYHVNISQKNTAPIETKYTTLLKINLIF